MFDKHLLHKSPVPSINIKQLDKELRTEFTYRKLIAETLCFLVKGVVFTLNITNNILFSPPLSRQKQTHNVCFFLAMMFWRFSIIYFQQFCISFLSETGIVLMVMKRWFPGQERQIGNLHHYDTQQPLKFLFSLLRESRKLIMIINRLSINKREWEMCTF